MPPTSVSLHRLQELYQNLCTVTENFQQLHEGILTENAQRLLILRLAAKLSQNEFEKAVGQESKNTSKYERGLIKRMRYETAKKYIGVLAPRIKNPSLNSIVSEFTRMQKESSGFFKAHEGSQEVLDAQRKGALTLLKGKSTRQEAELRNLLRKIGIVAKINHPLNEKRGIVTDIFLEELNTVIECKDIISKNHREYKRQLQVLAYQGYRIKFYFPNITLIALINSPFKISKRDYQELQGPFDNVFNDVGRLIKSLSSSRSQYGLNSLRLHAAYNA